MHGKTVQQAMSTTYTLKNKLVRYKNGDLKWDVNHGYLILAVPVPQLDESHINATFDNTYVNATYTNATFDTMPIKPVSNHTDGIGEDHVKPQFLSDSASHAIWKNAFTDPLHEGGQWVPG